MADPTKSVRSGTYQRDGDHCLCCGVEQGLSYQHRQAVGMGGSNFRPTWSEGITACLPHNERFERDLQDMALAFGWKVKNWVTDTWRVPVYDLTLDAWFLLSGISPRRHRISRSEALMLMDEIYGVRHSAWWAAAQAGLRTGVL
ncbi:hypothetical protein [uncultured Microbacterium sp.]|uniref:hypothetical protein n=1 Tax=uncultured Microbacterium sp. TaxID=191216 RepID=UPI0025E33D3C|nr:hypothetical protein [uncultured Microbacterium sp.]